ncbi:hypothetical protein BC629DRAFT_583640 [Irpex lacteus]|nr:hypothetical protein BC629DRAFT_583640 [Irpex lacteus]
MEMRAGRYVGAMCTKLRTRTPQSFSKPTTKPSIFLISTLWPTPPFTALDVPTTELAERDRPT